MKLGPSGRMSPPSGSLNNRSHFRKDGSPKKSYMSRDEADREVIKMINKYKTSFSVYRCLYCGKYHIGNTF